MLERLKKLFRRNKESSIEDVPELEFVPFEETDEWQNIKVYDRSNSERKQLYYKNKYVCSCSSEEVHNLKNYIVEMLLDGFSIDMVKEGLRQ